MNVVDTQKQAVKGFYNTCMQNILFDSLLTYSSKDASGCALLKRAAIGVSCNTPSLVLPNSKLELAFSSDTQLPLFRKPELALSIRGDAAPARFRKFAINAMIPCEIAVYRLNLLNRHHSATSTYQSQTMHP